MRIMLGTLILLFATGAFAQVRVLYQNDLSLNSNSTSALFISGPVSGNAAAAACSAYGEQLLPSVTADLSQQLDYLVFRGHIQNSSQIFFGGSSPAAFRFKRQASCRVYSIGSGIGDDGDCTASLPVLCTNSAPPTEVPEATAPLQGSHVSAGNGEESFLGYRDARSFRFLGIPFAQPPLGDLRFANAQPYNGSYNNASALAFGAGCLQTGLGLGGIGPGNYSEDCLYLNVYTPALPGKSDKDGSLPVAFWIHGGGYVNGAASQPDFDGGNMASRGDVVVVSANYRLGALGFLAGPSFNGSQGITDHIEALRWVQEHISSFGGDPNRVTIFGESAGGASILALISSTPAKGLFTQAISQSAPLSPFASRKVSLDGAYPAILAATGCNTTTDISEQLSCIRSVEASTFIANDTVAMVGAAATSAGAAPLTAGVSTWATTIGTGIVDDSPAMLISDGMLPSAGIAFMIGNMQDEATGFVESVPQLANPLPANEAILQLILGQALNNETVSAIANNPDLFAFNATNEDALRSLLGTIVTLDLFQCPLQQQLATAHARGTFSALYSFRFEKGTSQSVARASGLPRGCTANSTSGYDAVCHGEDVSLVFGTNNIRGNSTPFDSEAGLGYTQYVQDCWTSFIRTGNPQPDASYLIARGAAYTRSLEYSQAAMFAAYSGENTSTAIHVFDAPPRNTAPVYQPQCQILGFPNKGT